jgi:hypothetical protein
VTVKPMLGDWEVARISSIRTGERRRLVELPVPGRQGSLFQDLDGEPTAVVLTGSLYGDEARDKFLQQVREKFKAGEPVTFIADILNSTDVKYVIVEALRFRQMATLPDVTEYVIALRESPPPPPPPDPLGGLDSDLLDAAGGVLDSVSGALDAITALGDIPNFGDPTQKLGGLLDQFGTATGDLTGQLGSLGELFGGGD